MTDAADVNIRFPSGTDDPLSDAEIQQYREEINRLDQVILDAIKQRTAISQAIGKTRMSAGGCTRSLILALNGVEAVTKGESNCARRVVIEVSGALFARIDDEMLVGRAKLRDRRASCRERV